MTNYTDDDERCAREDDDECENPACEARERHYVEVILTVRFEVMAHDEDEAMEVANAQEISAGELVDDRVDRWVEEVEYDIESETERAAYERRLKEAMAKEAS